MTFRAIHVQLSQAVSVPNLYARASVETFNVKSVRS